MTNQSLASNNTPKHKVTFKASRDDLQMRLFMGIIALYLIIAVAFPLYAMFSKSLDNRDGVFVGIENYIHYFSTPALFYSIYNSLFVSIITTIITVSLAFTFAYALTRSCMVGKTFFKTIAMIPILVPSLLAGIALVYLFGNQGVIRSALFGHIFTSAANWHIPRIVTIKIDTRKQYKNIDKSKPIFFLGSKTTALDDKSVTCFFCTKRSTTKAHIAGIRRTTLTTAPICRFCCPMTCL